MLNRRQRHVTQARAGTWEGSAKCYSLDGKHKQTLLSPPAGDILPTGGRQSTQHQIKGNCLFDMILAVDSKALPVQPNKTAYRVLLHYLLL